MSEKMTFIQLPGSEYGGLANHGELSVAEMVEQYRAYARHLRREAEEVEAAADSDFRVFTARGIHVQRGQKVLQEGREK